MRKGKIFAALVTVLAVFAILPFAVSAEEPVKNGWCKDKGYYEYFYYGNQYKNGEYYISGERSAYFRFDSEGRMYDNEWYQDPETGKWYYYEAGGFKAKDCVMQATNGYYYGFDSDGVMRKDTDFELYSSEKSRWIYYKATVGGPLVVNEWVWYSATESDKGGFYRYHGADGASYSGIQQVNGTLYFFDDNGAMADDGEYYSWDQESQKSFHVRAKAGGALYRNEWYKKTYENSTYYQWYYYGDNGCAAQGLTTIGSTTYYFAPYSYSMLTSGMYHDSDEGYSYYADKYGNAVRLNQNGWTLVGNEYYYCEDGMYVSGQVKLIGEKQYLFNYHGTMLNNDYMNTTWNGVRINVRARAGGALYCNEWYSDGSQWIYYGSDCNRVDDGFFTDASGRQFYAQSGYVKRNEVFEADGKVYAADNSCVVTNYKDSWIYINGDHFYADGDNLLKSCISTIGGKEYLFDSSGRMYTEGVHEFEEIKDGVHYLRDYYLISATGAVVTEPGWAQYDGEWYYVTADGPLHHGLLKLDEYMYFLTPSMEYSTISYTEDGNLYLVLPGGTCQIITADGYYNTDFGKVLVENGKLVTGWKKVDSVWYYYAPAMVTNGYYDIDNDGCYYFDSNGVMKANGWIPYGESYMYADEYGRLANGAVNIGGTEYLFRGYTLCYDGYYTDDNGAAYVSDGEAHAARINDNGWTKVYGYWYYTQNGRVYTGNLSLEDGDFFLDYNTGRMLLDAEYSGSYYGADGRRQSGWKWIDGYWYYYKANHYKAQNGIYDIDGKRYCFGNGGKLLANTTYYNSWENRMYVVDASGIVSDDYTVPEGIVYYNGSAYLPDYEGWYGDYYFSDGQMVINNIIYDNGAHYYLDAHGKYIRNGWYNRNERLKDYDGTWSWLYADASGKLYYDEWAYIGNSWYYFRNGYMLSNGIEYIPTENRYAEFDASGKYLRYVEENGELPTGTPNTWEYIGGKFRYYNSTGTAVRDAALYIDGDWYAFDGNGYMLADTFSSNHYYNEYYYTSSGARLEAPNQWRIINGDWFYFGPDSSVVDGWIDINGTRYYLDIDYIHDYDTDETTLESELYTGYRCIDGKVFYFYENGACYGKYVGDGWLQLANGDFVYFKDGKLLKNGVYSIGGAKYYFYYNGILSTDDYNYNSNGQYVFASASGALYDAGWHYTDKGWVYVDNYGTPCINGVYEIGGVVYYFNNGYMV